MAVLTPRRAAVTLLLASTIASLVAAVALGAPRVAVAQQQKIARAHRAIATIVPAAQTAFDRGLVMLYAFNEGEARVAFRAAEAADPHATLAYFGEAVADTIDINHPTTPDGERRGAEAIARGRAAAAVAPPDEAALFAAAALRFDLKRAQHDRFDAYFHALRAYADSHPDDGMGLTLAAYACWNATGPLTWGPNDELSADAKAISAELDAALKLDPDDLGARHLRIHFWEESHRPAQALPDAEYFAALSYAPGESHLLHMAGHIFDRLGDFPRMIAVNTGALANDAAYFAQGNGPGQAYMRTYHEHDVSFVLYGLTTLGRDGEARGLAARETAHDRELVAERTHDGAALLELTSDTPGALRAIAEARTGNLGAARKDLAALAASSGDVDVLIATAIVARAAHDGAGAIAAYRKALAAAGPRLGDPKFHWQTPIAEGLGAVLLETDAPAAAEQVFRDELGRYPNDPRLEFGLARALSSQGKDATVPQSAAAAGWHGKHPLVVDDLG